MSKHLAAIGLIAIAVFICYARVTTAYFCGFDDFVELHRAMTEDTQEPARIFTTTHFDTSKYRPLQRGLTYIAWQIDPQSPLALRIRNVVFHVIGVCLLYGIVWLLTRDRAVAAAASLLFGLHPLANQPVVAAVWANTTANAILLASFFFFLCSLPENRRKPWPWLAACFGAILVALFTYEAAIVIFGFIYGYLAIRWWTKLPASRGYLLGVAAGSAAVLLPFFTVRHMVVTQRTGSVALPVIVKNLVMNLAAMAMPVDTILANTLWDTPLPSELVIPMRTLVVAAAIAAVVIAAAAFLVFRQPACRAWLKSLPWPLLLFLAGALLFSLGPFLAFTPHASETYLYLPVVFYTILLCLLVRRLLPGPRAYIAAVSVLAVLGAAGVWARNQRVIDCGTIARNILTHLPVANWRAGDWRIRLASLPDMLTPSMYGIYGYSGLSTLEREDSGIRAAECAVRLAARNPQIQVDIVSPEEIRRDCSAPGTCFWVSASGNVQDAVQPTASRR
jgi:hypothetical protein